jgi:hypothetical protein
LFVAGLTMVDIRERRIVYDLLRGIETDLGWATEYRVKQLVEEWVSVPLELGQASMPTPTTAWSGQQNLSLQGHRSHSVAR